MLTLNVYDHTFFVHASEYGTAFTLDVDNKQYLISARHVIGECDNIKLFHQKTWIECPVSLVGVGSEEVDICVLAPIRRLVSDSNLEASAGDYILGQDTYFVGFPFKMSSEGGDLMSGHPVPFVKKGTISAGFDPSDTVKKIYVDAINNEGFSGGPLLVAKPGSREHYVIGVVSKFRLEYEPVIDKQGEETDCSVAYNTGFLVAYGMKHVFDLIETNPIGLPIGTAPHT